MHRKTGLKEGAFAPIYRARQGLRWRAMPAKPTGPRVAPTKPVRERHHLRSDPGMIESLKAASGQAVAAARETLHEAELNDELARAYRDLGRATFELLRKGTLADRRLKPTADHIREQTARLAMQGHEKAEQEKRGEQTP